MWQVMWLMWVLVAFICTGRHGPVAQLLSACLLWPQRSGVRICKITNVFCHQIELNWHRWSPQRVHKHSMSSLSSTAHGVPMDSVDCMWSAYGVHGKVWGSVKYSAQGLFVPSPDHGKTLLGCMSIFPDGQKDGNSITCKMPGAKSAKSVSMGPGSQHPQLHFKPPPSNSMHWFWR